MFSRPSDAKKTAAATLAKLEGKKKVCVRLTEAQEVAAKKRALDLRISLSAYFVRLLKGDGVDVGEHPCS